jgi:hypothetical protein
METITTFCMIISALSLTTAFYVYTYNRAYAAGFHDGAAKQLQRDKLVNSNKKPAPFRMPVSV